MFHFLRVYSVQTHEMFKYLSTKYFSCVCITGIHCSAFFSITNCKTTVPAISSLFLQNKRVYMAALHLFLAFPCSLNSADVSSFLSPFTLLLFLSVHPSQSICLCSHTWCVSTAACQVSTAHLCLLQNCSFLSAYISCATMKLQFLAWMRSHKMLNHLFSLDH